MKAITLLSIPLPLIACSMLVYSVVFAVETETLILQPSQSDLICATTATLTINYEVKKVSLKESWIQKGCQSRELSNTDLVYDFEDFQINSADNTGSSSWILAWDPNCKSGMLSIYDYRTLKTHKESILVRDQTPTNILMKVDLVGTSRRWILYHK